MDYDTWKSGYYDTEPDREEYCSHNHIDNKEAIKDLIDALYTSDKLNVDFIKEQIMWLARDYNVHFDVNKPLNIELKPKVDNTLFQFMTDVTVSQLAENI